MAYQGTEWKTGDVITATKLNKVEQGVAANAAALQEANAQLTAAQEAVAAAQAAAARAEEAIAANTEADEATRAQAQAAKDAADTAVANAETALEKAQDVLVELEANAAADAEVAQQVQENIQNIQANATKAQEALDAIAQNEAADAQVRALAEANSAAIEANAQADAAREARLAAVEASYVDKNITKNGFKAQTTYNLVTHKYEDTKVQTLIFGEADGGGALLHNKTLNIKTFIGVNDPNESGGIWAQFYAKNVATNVGTRMNFTDKGVFYTVDKADGSFVASDELATKGTVAAAIGDLVIPEDTSDAVAQLSAQVVALTKALDAKNFTVASDVTEGDVTAEGKAITLAPTTLNKPDAPTTITAKSVTSDALAVESSVVKVVATDVVNFTNTEITGAYNKATQGNAQVVVNGTDVVRFVDGKFTATGYNQIEVWNTGDAAPSRVEISGCEFRGASNVPVQIHATAENAVVTIKDCVFGATSNPIRFSNVLNISGVTAIIENCSFEGIDAAPYDKLVLLQDHLSQSAEDAVANNRFGKDKFKIVFKNCTLNGQPLNGEADHNGIGNLVYLWVDHASPQQLDATDEANIDRFPTIELL